MTARWMTTTACDELRDAAESVVRKSGPPSDRGESRDALVFELSVRGEELQMQNDALREASAALQQARDQYRDLFDNAPIGYVVVDPQGRVDAANERAGRVLGAAPPDLIGQRLARFLDPEEAVPFEQYRRQIAQSEEALSAEFTIVLPGGRKKEVRFDGARTGTDGEWRIALRDVTAYNAVLRRLDHDVRLGAVERHASGVAHDLNNLLYSILGHADVALRFLDPAAEAYAPVMRLREVVHRCARATEQLATFSRAEESHPSIVDLNGLISESSGLLHSLLDRDVELELALDAADPAVRIDPAHVEQILLTAARNANQAMPHGGVIRIETTNVEMRGPTDALGGTTTRFVRWTIADTGIGMDVGTRRRAFEPFFTTKPPGVGTGLGLAMVKAAVERANGFVALGSDLGRGTRLVIHLPRATGTTHFPPAPGTGARQGGFARVMIVKDDLEGAAQVANRLRNAGCEVVRASSGSDAIDALDDLGSGLSVLLVDQALPDFVVGELMRTAEAVSPAVEVIVTPLTAADAGTGATEGDGAHDDVEEAVKLVLAAAIRTNAQ